jgi:hypothetical protein
MSGCRLSPAWRFWCRFLYYDAISLERGNSKISKSRVLTRSVKIWINTTQDWIVTIKMWKIHKDGEKRKTDVFAVKWGIFPIPELNNKKGRLCTSQPSYICSHCYRVNDITFPALRKEMEASSGFPLIQGLQSIFVISLLVFMPVRFQTLFVFMLANFFLSLFYDTSHSIPQILSDK